MKIKDILVVNSYAGSLLVAAKKFGRPIRGSYEDAGYGMPIQQLNFPELDFRATTKDWPATQDLSHTVVIAHPPCAAFSNQASKVKVKGSASEKFRPTRQVLAYAMKNNCAAIAVESVCGAKEGARKVHDLFAKKYGYRIFRVGQNAISFGLAQWRPRFWVIYIRRDISSDNMGLALTLKPRRRTIRQVLDKTKSVKMSHIMPSVIKVFTKQRVWLNEHGLSSSRINEILGSKNKRPTDLKDTGQLVAVLSRQLNMTREEATKLCVYGTFTSCMIRILHPELYSPVLLCGSNLIADGRPLTIPEHCDLMGFPRNYKWPANCKNQIRAFLSRGVCPPVAHWILSSVCDHIERRSEVSQYTQSVEDGGEVIFQAFKKDYGVK